MSINPKIIEHVQKNKKISLKDLVALWMEEKILDSREKEEFAELQNKWTWKKKIKLEDFVLSKKLHEASQQLNLDWEKIDDLEKAMLTDLALKNPYQDFLRKIKPTHLIYKKIAQWQELQNLNNQKSEQLMTGIFEVVDGLRLGEQSDVESVLQSQKIDNIVQNLKGIEAVVKIAEVLKKANLLNSIENVQKIANLANQASRKVAKPVYSHSREESRIEKTIKHSQTIKTHTNVKLAWKVKIGKWWEKSQNQKKQEAYLKWIEIAQEKAQEHLNVTLAKENRLQQKRFKEKKQKNIVTSTQDKYKKAKLVAWLYGWAGAVAGGVTGWAFLS